MPFTTIKVIEGVFSDEQKAEMIEKVTEAMVEVEGEGMRDLTWVTIEEVKRTDWAIGGKFPKPKPKSSQRDEDRSAAAGISERRIATAV